MESAWLSAHTWALILHGSHFAQISPKSNQICSNPIKNFALRCGCISSFYGTDLANGTRHKSEHSIAVKLLPIWIAFTSPLKKENINWDRQKSSLSCNEKSVFALEKLVKNLDIQHSLEMGLAVCPALRFLTRL